MESILLSVTYLPLGSLSGPGRDHQKKRELRRQRITLGEKGKEEADCEVIVAFLFYIFILKFNFD